MVYCVGLTGNIASGKTTVAKWFENQGIAVFNADKVARDLTARGTNAYEEIIARHGDAITQTNGEIDRRQLRHVIFADANERLWLEQLLHPLIRDQLAQQVRLSQSPYAVAEIPLLKDKALYPYLNRVLVVTASPEVQIARVMARDHCTIEQARAILQAQPGAQDRLQIADDVLVNDGNMAHLTAQAAVLHNRYLLWAA